MRLTLGSEESLTDQTITETLRRVEGEIRREAADQLDVERVEHQKTQQQLALHLEEKKVLSTRLYWKSRRRAALLAKFVSVGVTAVLVLGFFSGLGLRSANPVVGWILILITALAGLLGLANVIFGTSVKKIHQWVQDRCMTWLLAREAKTTGLRFEDASQSIVLANPPPEE
jgi:hypothetical protein